LTHRRAMPQRLLKLSPTCWMVLLLWLPLAAALGAEQQSSTGQQSDAPGAPEKATASEPAQALPHQLPWFKALPRQVIRDQKFLWLRPFRPKLADAPWVGAFLTATGTLMATDRRVAQGLSATPPGAGYRFSRNIGRLGSPLTDAGVAGLIFLVGRQRGDERVKTTGLLGWQALADSLLIVEVLKNATQRPRPTFAGGSVRNHNADGEFFAGGRAFPSGHPAGAWAIATVISQRHRKRRWIPPVAYGLAGLVSVSRITQRRHFPSDVFVGATLGYLIGRHVARSAEPDAAAERSRLNVSPYLPPGGGSSLMVSWEF
jgi:membrane-associated phospholipid phosphatase